MKRRDFIKKAALTTAGALVSPYILPSGRLFAKTGGLQKAGHVVLVMFAGGVRQQESVEQGYLYYGQGMKFPTKFANINTPDAMGNVMPNIFNGAAPDPNKTKIVYGIGSGNTNPIPPVLTAGNNLQSKGTLFKEIKSYTGGHYGGWVNLLQGNSAASQGLKQKPIYPTIFEYVRKELNAPATKVWFVGNGIGASIPLLNYSDHPNYGSKYGANFFAPLTTFGIPGQTWFENAKTYDPTTELSAIYKMKAFLDNSFLNVGKPLPDIKNTEAEKYDIHNFMKQMYTKTHANSIVKPPVTTNGDGETIGYAAELMKYFEPTLTVVNLSAVDTCHQNYTGYLQNLHAADHAVGFLWDYIQNNIPGMKNDTVMIVTPECGRDFNPNPIQDTTNGYYSYDHSDSNSQRAWCSLIGADIPQGLVRGDANNQIGLTTNVVPTIAEILGIKTEVVNAGFLAPGTKSFYELLS